MKKDFQHGLCDCFSNIGLCLITYFVPCYTHGKNAEAVGDSCLVCGILYFVPIANIVALVQVRGKIRDSRDIEGSCINDFFAVICCHFCALVQSAQEVQEPGILHMARC
jgi:Cys-rich protein (TIGR01571 family)